MMFTVYCITIKRTGCGFTATDTAGHKTRVAYDYSLHSDDAPDAAFRSHCAKHNIVGDFIRADNGTDIFIYRAVESYRADGGWRVTV